MFVFGIVILLANIASAVLNYNVGNYVVATLNIMTIISLLYALTIYVLMK